MVQRTQQNNREISVLVAHAFDPDGENEIYGCLKIILTRH